ncbi:phospholipase D family protein [Niveispirillum irakense]|uniref:phospholipase D family protein n=1 Tax=Niveispirillum irakense TaxID=34011 RepID=UPI000420CA58|nr:phospholipase D family protein [Niveispirillum irakense]
MNGINGNYLQYITENHSADTEEVIAAVAYATESSLLFDWCLEREIPLTFYGRLDEDVPVSYAILDKFLKKKSPNFACFLVQHHHAKIIWWKGVGVYVGSANLTQSAWNKNIEAGCFFDEAEISEEMEADLNKIFEKLTENSTPLTEELANIMKDRERSIYRNHPKPDAFWKESSLKTWGGLTHVSRLAAEKVRKNAFLEEWYSTLQVLRDIADTVSTSDYRPIWVNASAPKGSQADQFLHAYYYQRTFDGRKANYRKHFEDNKTRKLDALQEAMKWWHKLPSPPQNEDIVVNEKAPLIQALLSKEKLSSMSYEDFHMLCSTVHAFIDYSRRVKNKSVKLKTDGTKYTIPQKIDALSHRIWNDQTENGLTVRDVLSFILYGGSQDQLPERLWKCISDPQWKLEGLGVSALGEIVGWALPERFPPRNGRTSKALRSLGFPVKIHVQ